MTPSPLTLTLTLTQPFEGSPVWLELSEHDPDSQAKVAPARGLTGLNLETLRGGQWDPEKYGKMLRDQVFQDPALTAYFREVQAKAEGRSAAWSPDGTRIVTASDDGTARVRTLPVSPPPLCLSPKQRVTYVAEDPGKGSETGETGEARDNDERCEQSHGRTPLANPIDL